jgi:hypothetical protein
LRQTEAGITAEREILTAERDQFCRDRFFQESELRRFGMKLPSPANATMIADLHEKIAKTGVRLAELDEQLENASQNIFLRPTSLAHLTTTISSGGY